MPKEYIHSQDHGREAILFEDGKPGEMGTMKTEVINRDSIKISWSKESGNVSLAVLDYEKDIDGFEAKHINLDRDGLNRAIRFLRRARDDAFGKDE